MGDSFLINRRMPLWWVFPTKESSSAFCRSLTFSFSNVCTHMNLLASWILTLVGTWMLTSYGPYSLGFSNLYNREKQTSVLYKVSSLRYCGQVPHFKLRWWHTALTIQFVSFSWALWFAHNFRSKLDSLELCNVAYNTLNETKFVIFLSNKQNF